ncbi:MAG: hypothetical protein A2534_02195 [Candidatus Magasanikbacteria bacterium RIFOXYD2_FULL_39_9]|uniref:O-antigen ligase-related domain-containing protein n=1 Tax=Candidatus Magasanikbacteria bacterium RIFOXYD1_FULL_40_23 TaxID=1798705 RepID=A0A1F6P9F4_9BACT|nr:MAG: hypothetical protein A2563_03985 [Candidatus Magasanikbacteria bacterium RIFOXYD1_FULL_40_23]OGH93509.1 MAG: hypothetical protein A2534_02195 [Candidatus Magasanikbacteria bacterium RIFOXYD2_FULL_39_9]
MEKQNRGLILQEVQHVLALLFLFLLPWQTRYIWKYGQLNGGYWEYGTGSLYVTEILLWVILVLFFVNNFLKKEVWVGLFKNKNVFSLVFAGFLAVVGASVMLSENFGISYNYIFRILEGMAIMTVLFRSGQSVILNGVKDPLNTNERDSSVAFLPQNDRYVVAIWLGAVGQGALAIYQFLTQHVFASKWLGMAAQESYNLGPSVIQFADQRWLRAYGSFGSPNSLGIYLAVLFVLGFILYFKTQIPRYKILISVGQLFILSGLLLSFSRGAWLAALVGLASLFIVLFFKQKDFLRDFIKQIVFALGVAIFWIIIFYPVFNARFNLQNRLEATSVSERKGQYSESLSFIKLNPIFGVGPGVYTFALAKKYPDLASWQLQPIHNIYLLILVEMGIFGMLAIFLSVASIARLILKNNLIYAPVLTALFASGMLDHWLASLFTGMVFWWVVLGLGLKKNP